VQIEPDFNIHSYNTWLTDKGRQFFDGIFGVWNSSQSDSRSTFTNKSWNKILNSLIQTIYIFEHCQTQQSRTNFFIIAFENINIELVSLLKLIENSHSFVKIRRAENFNSNNDLESNLQLNLNFNKANLNNSTFCLLVSTNPRYEGFYLNLNLRQRFLKGNFECVMIGSLIDLTFPVSFQGSNMSVLKTIFEGNNLLCQKLKISKNPILVYNYELLRQKENLLTNNITPEILKYAGIFNKTWNGINVLSPSISETGAQSIHSFSPISVNDLNSYSTLYLINVAANNLTNLNKIIDLRLFYYSTKKSNITNKLFVNQSKEDHSTLKNNLFENQNNIKELVIPSNNFYETEATYINTEGFIKRTTKLIFRKKTKSNWQIVRKIFKSFENNLTLLNNSKLINYDSKKLIDFKNYIYFQYQATQTLTNLNFYLSIKNTPFIIQKDYSTFKSTRSKIKAVKLKYWLDDFFGGGKDEYSHKSLVLANCSKILRTKSSNFF